MNKSRIRRFSKAQIEIGIVLLLTVMFVTQCGLVVMSPSFSGTVIDSENGGPIEGVAVVAKWDIHGVEYSTVGVLAIEEAVTDSAGKFTIPNLGPRFNKKRFFGGLSSYAPELIIFKNGYEPQFIRNYHARTIAGVYRTADALDGRTVSLEPNRGEMIDYVQLVQGVDSRVSRLLTDPDCTWQQIPRLLAEVHRAGLSALETSTDIGAKSLLISRIPQNNCIDPLEYFGEIGE